MSLWSHKYFPPFLSDLLDDILEFSSLGQNISTYFISSYLSIKVLIDDW